MDRKRIRKKFCRQDTASEAFGQRLEATLRYQKAVLPRGLTARRQYLRVGQRLLVWFGARRVAKDGAAKSREAVDDLHTP
jgi:hypothetical protein